MANEGRQGYIARRDHAVSGGEAPCMTMEGEVRSEVFKRGRRGKIRILVCLKGLEGNLPWPVARMEPTFCLRLFRWAIGEEMKPSVGLKGEK